MAQAIKNQTKIIKLVLESSSQEYKRTAEKLASDNKFLNEIQTATNSSTRHYTFKAN